MRKWSLPIVVLLVAIIYRFYTTNFRTREQSPVLNISSGKIQGLVDTSRDGREFFSYLGIPYAKVKRFEPPAPVDKWTDVRISQEYGPICPQVDGFSWKAVGVEDCLSINVHRPKDIAGGKLLPVLIFIHGGYFMSGSGKNHMPHYLMDENIVYVTFNYRVGALGFLSTQDDQIPGNMGLKDQAAALEWVKKNIEYFNGNPKKVTIFGESAGAASVHFHILSPMSKGLFHRAISNSGSAIKIWSLSTKPKEQAERLGKRLNCPTETSELLVACLRNLDVDEITQSQLETITPKIDPLIMYAPTVEVVVGKNKKAFLSEHPYTLVTEGRFNSVPYITGINSAEGHLITGRIEYEDELMTELEENWPSVLPLYLLSPPENFNLTRQILEFYLKRSLQPNDKINFKETVKPLTDMMTDRNYLVATREVALHHAKAKNPVFIYYNKYVGQWSFTTFFGFRKHIPMTLQFAWKLTYRNLIRALGLHFNDIGVCHGDDIFLFFKTPYMEIMRGSQDYEFSRSIIKTWVSFASADPSLKFNGIVWNPININDKKLQYLTFESSGNHGIKDEEFTERVEFWNKLNLQWIL